MKKKNDKIKGVEMEKQIVKLKSPVCISPKVDSNPHTHTQKCKTKKKNSLMKS